MRVTENMQASEIAAHGIFALAMVVTSVLAAMQSFGSNVLASRWARLVTVVALVGAVYLGTSRDFYMPFLGPTVVPTSVLHVATPKDSTVAMAVDAPKGATHAMYWAAGPTSVPCNSPAIAYRGFNNAGIVRVAGGRATLRLACPGVYKVGWGRVLPRHVHYRFIFENGVTSGVHTARVNCP
jgi:hypothetical protein